MFAILALLASPAFAHIALWHPSAYGWVESDKQQDLLANPLQLDMPFDKWWFHGQIDKPPAAGQFLSLPAGGVLTGQLSGSKERTEWGLKPFDTDRRSKACCNLHGAGFPGTEDPDPKSVMGTALSIVYNSDPRGFKPEDMVVISTNRTSPWWKFTDYHIPADLPPCPPGGCHCSWNWEHDTYGGGQEMYHVMYRCEVTNANANSPPLAKPQLARKCPYDPNNCTEGAKTPFWWTVSPENGGNIFQDAIDPPVYNLQYGFEDGAQNDIWYRDPGNAWTNDKFAPSPRDETKYETESLTKAPAPTGPSGAGKRRRRAL